MSKYEIKDMQALSITEVADQLMNSRLESDEKIGDVRFEGGEDLEIEILYHNTGDPRLDGYPSHMETFTISDIRECFTAADYYTWARGEDGEDVLLCFGC